MNRDLPIWSATEYGRRLRAHTRAELVQVFAWDTERAVGRGMALLPEHEEYSASAAREGCVEVRDVFVALEARRRGVAEAIMAVLEDSTRATGIRRIGLSVAHDDVAAPARALYRKLGYRYAHGPYIQSATLAGENGRTPVGAVLTYLIKDL